MNNGNKEEGRKGRQWSKQGTHSDYIICLCEKCPYEIQHRFKAKKIEKVSRYMLNPSGQDMELGGTEAEGHL